MEDAINTFMIIKSCLRNISSSVNNPLVSELLYYVRNSFRLFLRIYFTTVKLLISYKNIEMFFSAYFFVSKSPLYLKAKIPLIYFANIKWCVQNNVNIPISFPCNLILIECGIESSNRVYGISKISLLRKLSSISWGY